MCVTNVRLGLGATSTRAAGLMTSTLQQTCKESVRGIAGVFLPILSYLGDYSDVDYEVGCPCGQGLVEEGGVCVLAPSRSSSGATPPGVTPPMTPLAPLPVEPAAPVDTELPAPTGTPVDTEAPIDMSPPDVPTSMGAPVENAEAPVDTVAAPVDNDAEPSEDLFGSYGEVEVAYGI